MEYRIKTARNSQIAEHLKVCDKLFVPALSQRVNINEYALKIADKAVTFEAWQGSVLVGLVAVYVNADALTSFITSVSVLNEYSRAGVAKELLQRCINYLKTQNIQKVSLEVGVGNRAALELYKKLNFIEYGSGEQIKTLELKIF